MNNTAATYKKIYKEYSSRNIMNDNIKILLDKFIGLINGIEVLDIGCASGRESKYLCEKGFNVTGIGITEEFLNIAKI